MGQPVLLERDGPLAVLTFDAPPLNLFDAAMIAALQAAVADVAADPPRGLLMRAEGRVVSGGSTCTSSTASLPRPPASCGPSCCG